MTPTMRRFVEGRLFEWTMATSMILLALEIFFWPNVLTDSSYYLLVIMLPTWSIGWFLYIFGIARIAALLANGSSKVYGPRVRFYGAVAGALLWGQFELSLMNYYLVDGQGPPSPAAPFWFTFIFAELYSAYRAASDVRDRSGA